MAKSQGFVDAMEAVKSYYGSGSDLWAKLDSGAVLTRNEIEAIKQVPGVTVSTTKSGKVVGMTYDFLAESLEKSGIKVNSNIRNPMFEGGKKVRVPANYEIIEEAGQPPKGKLTSGATKVTGGGRVMTAAGKITGAVMMVSAGAWLGKNIDSALYNIGNYFELNPPSSLDPTTWNTLVSDFGPGAQDAFDALFGIDQDSASMYLPEEALAYAYQYWLAQGAWNTGGYTPGSDTPITSGSYTVTSLLSGQDMVNYMMDVLRTAWPNLTIWDIVNTNIQDFLTTHGTGYYEISAATSGGSFEGGVAYLYYSSNVRAGATVSLNSNQYNFQLTIMGRGSGTSMTLRSTSSTSSLHPPFVGQKILTNSVEASNIDATLSSPIDGVSDDSQAQAINPTLIDDSTIQTIIDSLKQQYPQLFADEIERGLPDPDTGQVEQKKYVPTPFPNLDDATKPTRSPSQQLNPKVDPDTSPETQQDKLTDVMVGPISPIPQPPAESYTPPDTGSGDSPTVVPSTGSASSLWAIYNPSQAEIDSFGAWLWSSNLVDQIKKLFSDPMQAIIGVHKVFATPSTGTAQNIKVGYLDSGVSAAVVTDQYTTVDCGTVNIREYYGNVLDYSPYTEVSLYLPFIGIVRLDNSDVMRASISVKYHVDVLTGACLADVKVTRDAAGGVLYQYAGSAIVTYPVSSGSYIGAVAGVLGIAGGVAGTVLSGGALAPALMGGALGASHLHADVQHSGGFSGAAGAMGGKKPYIIISRPQGATPNLDDIKGTPATKRVTLGSCSGYTVVDQVNLDGIPATSGELAEIETLLKQGVIV